MLTISFSCKGGIQTLRPITNPSEIATVILSHDSFIRLIRSYVVHVRWWEWRV